ncbi:hypothetical protein ACT17_06095 [Mycolicibacterium conceptionense]|uniref:ESX-1 secretion system protein EccA1-like N-terminal domain-containing protein n=1 Tax=Mycolicibacterium conceptionense TaxID=451644 RepID=A0A0J8X2D1_9MYCO|nr:hypothetical protein [Mycolicibacterium conceptionense]KMV19614.1 hypothetical protein ACT17_06095 [Mycolicibacterium conceptionense]
MAHATNRTEMLAKALKRAREDFSLHNARVFARSVIEAPPDVFAAKPLTFLPLDQSSSYRWRAAAESARNAEELVDPNAAAELARANATSRYIKEKYSPDSSTWSPPDGLDPDGPAAALAKVVSEMSRGNYVAARQLRDAMARWPEQCDLRRAYVFAGTKVRRGDNLAGSDALTMVMDGGLDTFGELVAELGLEPDTFSMVWELPEVPLQLPLVTRTDVRTAYAAHAFAAGDQDAANRELDLAILADKDTDLSRVALSRRAATAVESMIAFKNERWDELAGLAAELSAPGADRDDNTAEALVALGYGFAALALMEQGSSGNAMLRAAESYQFVAVNAWLDLQLGLRARRAGDEDSAQRHFGAGLQQMRLPELYEAAAAVQPSPRARRREERAALNKQSSDALRSMVGDTLDPILPGDVVTDGEGSEHEFGVYMGEDRVYTRDGQRRLVDLPEARTVHYDVRQVDPLTAITNPDLAWVSTLAQLTALCGWDADTPEALLLDKILRPEYRQQRSITTLAELVDHLRNSGDKHARAVHDRIRFRITDPSPLVDHTAEGPVSLRGSGRRVDFPDATSARRAQEQTATSPDGAADQALRAASESAGIQLNAEDERRVRVSPTETPPVDRTVAVSPSQVRPGDLLITGGKTYVSLGNRTLLDIESRGIVREDELADEVPFTGSEEGYFRPVGRQGEWAAFAKALSTEDVVTAAPKVSVDPLKVVPPSKFPQLAAESEDQIDVPALVREMGGSPQAGELFDRVVPMSMMSRAMIKAISSGAVKLNADRTVTLPEQDTAEDPMLNLPASAIRPRVTMRQPDEAVKLWEETVFHVGIGTGGPVTWSPAEAGSMMVTGRTGSGTSMFVGGMITQARLSGWEVIWLDRFNDADTYAEMVANAHALSTRRTVDQAPVLVVLDEFQAFSRKFAAAHTKAEVAQLHNQMLDMLELASTARVHPLLVTHDLHAQTIPSTWLPHFGAAVAMGRPSEMALRKLAGDVKVPSEAFPKDVRGRGVFFDRAQPGTYQAVQTYLPTQAKDALAFAFGEDEMARMDPELARKLVERPDRPLTPHEFIAGINGGPKLWDAVGDIAQNKTPVDSVLGSTMGALFGRPASAPMVDQSKPNHFYFDSLGDPLTCTEDHNHPSGPDDEPGMNVRVRAEHELERLPEPVDRPVAPRDGDRSASVSELGLGVGSDGERRTYAPATDGPLLIIGDRGRGKTSMVRGLYREAEALGWETVCLETQKTSRYVRDRLDEVREEVGRRVVGASGVSKPVLITLDDSLFTDWGDESRTEISTLVTTLLEKGPKVNVHLVAATGPRQLDYFLSLWPAGAAVLLTGQPATEEASALFGDAADLLPRSGWEGSGKMVLVRDPKVTGGFLPAPLRAYIERQPKRYDDL